MRLPSIRWAIKWDPKLWPFLVIFLLALGMRLWDLEVRPIHYDESIHAQYSFQLFQGQGYRHDPMMHGPFKFLATAGIFHLLGDSDFTARLLPALLGSLLVVLPYLLRRQLGEKGALLTAGLLAFSPSFLYFSRFLRDDILIAFWTLLLVAAIWRYWEEKRDRYLYLAAFALVMAVTTMEATLLLLPLFLLYLFFFSGKELLTALRRRANFSSLSPPATLFLVLFTLALPQYAAATSLLQGPLGITLASRTAPEGAPVGVGLWVAGAIVLFLFLFSLAVGLRWSPRRWLVCAAIFYGIYIPLYSTFFANPLGLGTGVWGSLSYWLVQHGKNRLAQPWFYYPLLLSIYEFLPLLLGGAGFIYYLFRRSRFTGFLLYWAAATLTVFSYTGEKAPWLLLHPTLPLLVLAGKFGGELWERRRSLPWAVGAVVFLLAFAFWVRVSWQASYAREDRPVELLVFAQGSWDNLRVLGEVRRLSSQGAGRLLIDPQVSWPWVWYLRHQKDVVYSASSPGPRDIVVVPSDQEGAVDLAGHRKEKFAVLLWFPEGYKAWHARELPRIARWWWGYFAFRHSDPWWNSQGVAFFPRL